MFPSKIRQKPSKKEDEIWKIATFRYKCSYQKIGGKVKKATITFKRYFRIKRL
jgi:hypothetical protein